MHTVGANMQIGTWIEQDDCATSDLAGMWVRNYSEQCCVAAKYDRAG